MENKKTIRKLFLQFNDEISKYLKLSKEYEKSIDRICENYKILSENLDDSLIKILDNMIDLQNKISAIETEESFVNGFSMASRLLMESNKN